MKKIEKKALLNDNLRIFAEAKHPVQEVTIDELIDMIRNSDGKTIFNVTIEGGDE